MSSEETVRDTARERGAIELPRFGSSELTEATDYTGPPDTSTEDEEHVVGSYRLMEQLGEGGFGVVWRAEQHEPIRREVALKVIKPGMDSREIIARFEAERQTLALMDHPNIAAVLDAGTTKLGRPFFVMELVQGVPITIYCDAHRLTIAQRIELFIPVCKAVQHAHQKSILHRDLKPSNILVEEVDGRPVPKVIDFGIAKAIAGSPEAALQGTLLRTQDGALLGTPQYMSPEQAGMVADMDTRSDIYTLGVILYELLVGTPPLSRETLRKVAVYEMLRLIREQEAVRPSSRMAPITEVVRLLSATRSAEPAKLNRALQGDLDWITLKALEKERDRRYDSAAALAQDLERHLSHQPVEAGSPSAFYRLGKLVRRNRLAVASTVAILFLLVAGITVSTSQAVRAKRAEGLAIERLQQVTAERRRTAQALSRADHRQAVKLIAEEKLPEALAHLARAIRTDPNNSIAGAAVTSLLAQRNWALPLVEPLSLKTSTRHASLSPDGRKIANADGGNLLKVWDFETGNASGAWMEHPSNVLSSVFNQDGRFLATTCATNNGASDWGVRVWDVEKGLAITDFIPFDHGVEALALSPDGRLMATATGNAAQFWNVPSGKPQGDPVPMEARVHYLTFSPDGGRLLLTAWDTARIWDVRERKLVGEPMSHLLMIEFAAFSPDGTLVATTSYDKTVRVWDARTGAAVTEPIPHEDAVVRVAFSPDGRRIVTACEDNATRIFDARTGKPLSSPMMHGRYIRDVIFSADGRRVLSASGDYDKPLMGHVWDAQGGASLSQSMRHTEAILAAAFSPDGTRVATASKDATACLWNAKDVTLAAGPLQHDGPVNGIAFSSDGRLVATASDDGTARVWDAGTGTPVGEPLHHEAAVLHIGFSADGRRVVTASRDMTARIWDARSGKELAEPLRHEAAVTFATFSPDGEKIVTASADNTARVWDASNGRALTEPMKHDLSGETGGEGVQSAMFSPDGNLVLTSSKDHTARLWDARSGEHVGKPLLHPSAVNSAVFSHDGKLVVTACGEYGKPGSARVWRVESGTPVTEPLQHLDGVVMASFSVDDRRLVTASFDKTARVWDVQTGQPIGEPLLHEGFVTGACFGPQSNRVLTSTWDGEARLWNLPEGGVPVPSWLADLAEAVGGTTLNEADVFENVLAERFFKSRETLTHADPTDGYSRFAHWFFAPRITRMISPGSWVAIPDYVTARLKEGTVTSLENAYRADPGNVEVWNKLRDLKEESH